MSIVNSHQPYPMLLKRMIWKWRQIQNRCETLQQGNIKKHVVYKACLNIEVLDNLLIVDAGCLCLSANQTLSCGPGWKGAVAGVLVLPFDHFVLLEMIAYC